MQTDQKQVYPLNHFVTLNTRKTKKINQAIKKNFRSLIADAINLPLRSRIRLTLIILFKYNAYKEVKK